MSFGYRLCSECRDRRETQVLAILVRTVLKHDGLFGKSWVLTLCLLKFLTLNASRGCVVKDWVPAVRGRVWMMQALVQLVRRFIDMTVIRPVSCSGADCLRSGW